MYKSSIGQDSHRFVKEGEEKPLVLGGLTIPNERGLDGNSDADVLLHALTNAITGVTGITVLGKIADKMCAEDGITDSRAYLEVAKKHLAPWKPVHLSFTIEALKPKMNPHIPKIRESIANLMGMSVEDVCITATTGEGLTDFGKGLGIQSFVILTVVKE